jgi:hypothetical protein
MRNRGQSGEIGAFRSERAARLSDIALFGGAKRASGDRRRANQTPGCDNLEAVRTTNCKELRQCGKRVSVLMKE